MKNTYSVFQQADVSTVQPQKASVAIYEQIRLKILTGELKPGDKLPAERDLVEMFQRSRPTVREALRMLENKNYVSISRGRGTTVNKISTNEVERTLVNLVRLNLVSVENIMNIRIVCEKLTISLAAQERTEQDIQIMEDILQKGDALATENFSRFMDNGILFNEAIAKASHNEMLYLIIRITSKFSHGRMSDIAARMSQEEKARLTRLISDQHHEMLAAIVAQDPEKAMELNDLHLHNVADTFYDM